MNCDPSSLMQSATCFQCIPPGMHSAVRTHLLCELANAQAPPCNVHWAPETELLNWHDAAGGHIGNLATFLATADIATVDIIFASPFPATLTEISELRCLPALQHVTLDDQPLLTLVDAHDSTSLLTLHADNGAITTLNVSGCTSLTDLSCQFNPGLTAITGIETCTALQILTCNDCNITGTLDVSNLTALVTLTCYGNVNMTAIDASACTSMDRIDCFNSTLLSSLIVSGDVMLTYVQCQNCNLAQLDFTGCNIMAAVDCSGNILTDLRIGASTLWGSIGAGILANDNLLPANPPGAAEGVDDILARLAVAPFPLGNPDTLDLDTPATNASPTGGIANADYVALIGAGWAVAIN